ncbi:EF-hand domain-containing protein [Paralimibaculum aggregatum]|nr:hypothetical protein [Limibaculum sp. NKW23]
MKRSNILAIGVLAATAAIGAVAIPAFAHSEKGWGGPAAHGWMDGPRGEDRAEGRRGHGHGEHRRMKHRGGHGPMGMRALMKSPIYQSFDTDGDGRVTAAEAEAGITALHARHDANGDGQIDPAEFSTLFAEVTAEFQKRPFAMLDADGNGEISAEEMSFPAEMAARMQAWRDAGPKHGPRGGPRHERGAEE